MSSAFSRDFPHLPTPRFWVVGSRHSGQIPSPGRAFCESMGSCGPSTPSVLLRGIHPMGRSLVHLSHPKQFRSGAIHPWKREWLPGTPQSWHSEGFHSLRSLRMSLRPAVTPVVTWGTRAFNPPLGAGPFVPALTKLSARTPVPPKLCDLPIIALSLRPSSGSQGFWPPPFRLARRSAPVRSMPEERVAPPGLLSLGTLEGFHSLLSLRMSFRLADTPVVTGGAQVRLHSPGRSMACLGLSLQAPFRSSLRVPGRLLANNLVWLSSI